MESNINIKKINYIPITAVKRKTMDPIKKNKFISFNTDQKSNNFRNRYLDLDQLLQMQDIELGINLEEQEFKRKRIIRREEFITKIPDCKADYTYQIGIKYQNFISKIR